VDPRRNSVHFSTDYGRSHGRHGGRRDLGHSFGIRRHWNQEGSKKIIALQERGKRVQEMHLPQIEHPISVEKVAQTAMEEPL
jgi:hypothetical protein